jgi:DNA-binding GntR family transcriptional regulator
LTRKSHGSTLSAKVKSVYNMVLSDVQAVTRGAGAVDALRRAIVTCRLAPGSRLIQEELAERLGISRIPLREALRRLEGEGLVLIEPNRGAIVRPLDSRDVHQLYELRLVLERTALVACAERFEDLRGATAAKAAEAALAAKRRDLGRLIELDCAFHGELAGAGGNAHVVHALDGSWPQIARAMHLFLNVERYRAGVWAEHAAIVDAIALGDVARAVDLHERHIVVSRDVILTRLREVHHERSRGA